LIGRGSAGGRAVFDRTQGVMAMARSTGLRAAVKERFYPFVAEAGFARAKNVHPLFTVFVRHRNDTVQVFDIQWDKYHTPRFILNFDSAPRPVIGFDGSRIEISPFNYTSPGRLQGAREPFGWFTTQQQSPEVLAEYTPDEVVDEVISVFHELDDWWDRGIQGPHIYIAMSSDTLE
jgi:hypothetical protein